MWVAVTCYLLGVAWDGIPDNNPAVQLGVAAAASGMGLLMALPYIL